MAESQKNRSKTFAFNTTSRAAKVDIEDLEEFEALSGTSTDQLCETLLDGLDIIPKINITSHGAKNSVWCIYLLQSEEETAELDNCIELYFSKNPRRAYYEMFYPNASTQGVGSLNFKNVIQALQRMQFKHLTLMVGSRMSAYYFARMGGKPVDNWHEDTTGEKRCEKIRLHMKGVLKNLWQDITPDTRVKMLGNIEKIKHEHLQDSPSFLAEIASEREDIRGEPLGFRLFEDYDDIHYLFDLEDPSVMKQAMEYLDSKIALIPQALPARHLEQN